jgi:uncharacterized membrane protein
MKLVFDELMVWGGTSPWLWVVLVTLILLLVGALGFITFLPLFRKGTEWTTTDDQAGERLAKQIRPMTIKHIGVALEHAKGDAKIISAAITHAKRRNGLRQRKRKFAQHK